jgi:hypothetical protein
VEFEHIQNAHLAHDGTEQVRALVETSAHQQATVAATVDGQTGRGGVLLTDQVLGTGDEVIEHLKKREKRKRKDKKKGRKNQERESMQRGDGGG